MMYSIGIDVAYRSTGLVALNYDTGAIAASELVVPPHPVGVDHLGENLAMIAAAVVRFVNRHPGHVFVEQALTHNGRTARVLNQVHGAIYAALADAGHPTPRWWTVAEIKKRATGQGNARKPQMIDAARQQWGVDLSSDEADAAFCALLGLEHDWATFGGGR